MQKCGIFLKGEVLSVTGGFAPQTPYEDYLGIWAVLLNPAGAQP